jgi:hypothetical protein
MYRSCVNCVEIFRTPVAIILAVDVSNGNHALFWKKQVLIFYNHPSLTFCSKLVHCSA